MRAPLDLSTVRDLPGAETVERGIRDAEGGAETIESLLVAIGEPRLSSLGVRVPPACRSFTDAEVRLYELLTRSGVSDPFSHYNSLIRELVSFERALEQRVQANQR